MGVPQIFSLDTWRRLSDDERSKLTALLPDSCKSAAEAEQVLQTELFAQEPRRFGVTLSRFWDRLQAGAYGAEQLAAGQSQYLCSLCHRRKSRFERHFAH